MISVVSERYEIHPQPSASTARRPHQASPERRQHPSLRRGALRRLEIILTLTRDLGVNLAGVEVILT